MSRRTLGKPTGSSYSLGISVSHGRLVFISGIVAMDENGNVIAPGDMAVIPANVSHWHGAADTGSPMAHLMVVQATSVTTVDD